MLPCRAAANAGAWIVALLQLLVVSHLIQSLLTPVNINDDACVKCLEYSKEAEGPVEAVDEFPLLPWEGRSVRFGSSSNSSGREVTQAFCECYDLSCSLHLRNAEVKRTSRNRFVIFAVNGSNRAELHRILSGCKNGFPYCDTSQGSVLCAGLIYELGKRRVSAVSSAAKAEHQLVTIRSMGFEFFHGVLFPRGLLLNSAVLEAARSFICSRDELSCGVKSEILLLHDFHRPEIQPASRVPQEKKLVLEIYELIKFPHPRLFSVGSDRSARWITIENRIFHPVGHLALLAAHRLQQLLSSTPHELESHAPGTGLVLQSKHVIKPADKHFRGSLFGRLLNVSSLDMIEDGRISTMSFAKQLSLVRNRSFVVVDEGPLVTWMLFAASNSTWLMLYEYRLGYDLPNLRLHLRTWLLRRDCRFVAFVYWEDPASTISALLSELAKPFVAEVSIISNTGVVRCHDLLTCGNRVDHTLLVEHRAMYENGGYP